MVKDIEIIIFSKDLPGSFDKLNNAGGKRIDVKTYYKMFP